MKWFYKLKSSYRILIAIAAWLPLVILAGVAGGTAAELSTPVTIVGVLLLALGIAATVFAVKAAAKDKAERSRISNEKAAAIAVSDMNIDDRLSVIQTELDSIDIDAMPQSNNLEIKNKQAAAQKQLNLINEKKVLLNRKLAMMEKIDPTIKARAAVKLQERKSTLDDKTHSKPIKTKVVGVTFGDRQECIEQCEEDDTITVQHDPSDEYPESTIVIHDNSGNTLGHINKELAQELLARHGNGFSFSGEITAITGGDSAMYGCNIVFYEE